MGVDQARHHGAAREIEPAIQTGLGNLDDPAVLDAHRRPPEPAPAGAVDNAGVGQDHMPAHRTPPTSRPEATRSRTRSTSPASERSSATGGTTSARSDTAASSRAGNSAPARNRA